MTLVLIGVNHKTAPIELRERMQYRAMNCLKRRVALAAVRVSDDDAPEPVEMLACGVADTI